MTDFILPDCVRQLPDDLLAITNPVLTNIKPFLTDKLYFFPEYTDHGPKHVSQTLGAAFELATTSSKALMTPEDHAVLTMAVALHDFGMHLTREGFESLITPGCPWEPVEFFDSDKTWHKLWLEFFAEARRFDDRKLRALFGDDYSSVRLRPLPPKGEPWDEKDTLLVGEFLRRHHPRLAHEIALHGFPGTEGKALPIFQNSDDPHWADLAGLVARSHGMELRPCLDYLDKYYHTKAFPRRIHAPFLMVLLRLADYIQIQDSRAPKKFLQIHSLKSPLSAREWRLHHCVKDIHGIDSDPEAIFIAAEPKDVETYLHMKGWLQGVQKELDTSWAVLGEVYGRLAVHNVGIEIRRVKSNLDNTAEFSKTVPYVPAKFQFETAHADLLKLLVGPLYNNNPACGIRELIQNAVDSVREYEDRVNQDHTLAKGERYEQVADVVVHFVCDSDGTPSEICVTDRGIGMTVEVVRDYYLKAGASLRRSDAWRRHHEEPSGDSRVMRSGRFGVGALAAFLLGDELQVTTRHITQRRGISFTARIDDTAISITHASCPIGTSIRIKIPESMRSTIEKLVPKEEYLEHYYEYHYYLRKPSLAITKSNDDHVFSDREYLPEPGVTEDASWRHASSEHHGPFHWKYRGINQHTSNIYCNGILLGAMPHDQESLLNRSSFHMPCLSLFDNNGNLPINLQRNALRKIPDDIIKEIIHAITDEAIEFALALDSEKISSLHEDRNHCSFQSRFTREKTQWQFSIKGFILNNLAFHKYLNTDSFIITVGSQYNLSGILNAIQNTQKQNHPLIASRQEVVPKIINDLFLNNLYCFSNPLSHSTTELKYIYIKKSFVDIIRYLEINQQKKDHLQNKFKSSGIDWIKIFSKDNDDTIAPIFSSLPADETSPDLVCLVAIDPESWSKITKEDTMVLDRWLEVLGALMIPYDQDERQAMRERAARYIPSLAVKKHPPDSHKNICPTDTSFHPQEPTRDTPPGMLNKIVRFFRWSK